MDDRAVCLDEHLFIFQAAPKPATMLAAPVTLPLPGEVDVLAQHLTIDGREYRARLLDMSAVLRGSFGETVVSTADEADAILNAIDIILHGYPAGRPRINSTEYPRR